MFQGYQHTEFAKYLRPWLRCFRIEGNAVLFPEIKESTVRDAMQILTPDQRSVIELKIVKGLSNKKVADILSRSIGAVEAIQHKALIALFHLIIPENGLTLPLPNKIHF